MRLVSVRLAIAAAVMSATSVAAIAAPGSALALKQCEGGAIVGAGSSAQKLAQKEVWDSEAAGKGLGFNVGKNADACSKEGKKPSVTYESVGSGAGLERWGVEGGHTFLTTTAMVATDEPVNQTQKEEIESHNPAHTGEDVQSIPVLQFAVTAIIHLPKGCEGTSTAVPGRFVLRNKTLEEIWTAKITKWSQIKDGGDEVKGAGCNPEEEIKHVVRLDQSGTTHVFKRYLGLIQTQLVTPAFEIEGGETKKWNEIAEGAFNQKWPTADKVIRPAKSGGGEVVNTVFEEKNASSIGYANLADARAKFGGSAQKEIFWAEIQNNGAKENAKIAPTYTDPATNGDVSATANSNCSGEKYTNGTSKEKFPPATTAKVWSSVTTETKQTHYVLCGVTYDMGLNNYKGYGFSEASFQTADDYLNFVTDSAKEGGQTEVVGHDYEKLPALLVDITQDGVEEGLKFE